jgi:hypothetical protein
MAKKQFFLGIDTETTITDMVVDFGAAVCDRQGNIVAQCAVMVQNVFGVDDLFYDRNNAGIWSQQSVARRMDNYNAMLSAGSRMLASVNAINRWLEKVNGKYAPELFAYNLAFDRSKCQNTGIDLNIFKNSFCLWGAAVGNICKTKPYRQFVLDNHLFNNPTELGNMTFSTTAEAVTGYLRGSMSDEPHTSLEDLIGYEIPTLVHIAKKKNWREKIVPYNWRDFQVKDNFQSR